MASGHSKAASTKIVVSGGNLPFLVAVNEFDGAPLHALPAVREALALSEHVPLITVDARSRDSAKAALIAVAEYALSRLAPTG